MSHSFVFRIAAATLCGSVVAICLAQPAPQSPNNSGAAPDQKADQVKQFTRTVDSKEQTKNQVMQQFVLPAQGEIREYHLYKSGGQLDRNYLSVKEHNPFTIRVFLEPGYVAAGKGLWAQLLDKDDNIIQSRLVTTVVAPDNDPLKALKTSLGETLFITPSLRAAYEQLESAVTDAKSAGKDDRAAKGALVSKAVKEMETQLGPPLTPKQLSDAWAAIGDLQNQMQKLPSQEDKPEQILWEQRLESITQDLSQMRNRIRDWNGTIDQLASKLRKLSYSDGSWPERRQLVYHCQSLLNSLDRLEVGLDLSGGDTPAATLLQGADQDLINLRKLFNEVKNAPIGKTELLDLEPTSYYVTFDPSGQKKSRLWPGDMAVRFVVAASDAAPKDTEGPGFFVRMLRDGSTVQVNIGVGFFTETNTHPDQKRVNATDALGNNLTVGGHQLYTIEEDRDKVNFGSKIDGFAGLAYLWPESFLNFGRTVGLGRNGLMIGSNFSSTSGQPRVFGGYLQYLNRDEDMMLIIGKTSVKQQVFTGTVYNGQYYIDPPVSRDRWSNIWGSWFFGLLYKVKTSNGS